MLEDVNTDELGIKKCSSYHDVNKYPDMCLPATYNATHALVLLGAYQNIEDELKNKIANYINSYQQPNGAFRFRNMKEDEIWKGQSIEYSWKYIDNHITNYSIGALKSLGVKSKYPISFINDLKEPKELEKWLMERNLKDPWLEGNNVVNLASFLIYELEGKDDTRLNALMKVFFDWHDKMQDPNTGFWGTDKANDSDIMQAMAGAAHNFHLYFYYNREIPYYKKIIDYCLEFIKGKVKSACLDVDVVDILANFIVYGYREEEIKQSLNDFSAKLIDFQNQDGGFTDEKTGGVRRMDGWVRGYFEPQGLSNCFATWFRAATLAMIISVLSPEIGKNYRFRNTIGIGYFNPNYLKGDN